MFADKRLIKSLLSIYQKWGIRKARARNGGGHKGGDMGVISRRRR